MGDNTDKKLDSFAKRHIQEIRLESPSKGFTGSVMNAITAAETGSVTYKPLISKKTWLFVAAGIAAIFFIPFQKPENGGLLEKTGMDFSFFEKLSLSGVFDGVSLPSVTFYAFLLFAIMIFIQVFYIKGYFGKKNIAM